MNKFKLSAIASAAVLSAAVFTGCGSSSAGITTDSIQAADGYVLQLVTEATATCGTKTYTSALSGQLLTKGKITFNGVTLDSTCTISVPSDAIIDVNNNGTYEATVDKASGFEMKANGAAKYVSQLTTLVELKRANGEDVSELEAAVKDFDPVTALKSTTTTTGTSQTKIKNLIALAETVKSVLSSKSSATAKDIVTTKFLGTTEVSTNEIKTIVTTAGADTSVVTLVEKAVDVAKDHITNAPLYVANGVDLDKLSTQSSDGGVKLTAILEEQNITASDSLKAKLEASDLLQEQKNNAEAEAVPTATPKQKVTLGDQLQIGSATATLTESDLSIANFGTVSVNSSGTTLENFFSITLPTATLALNETVSTQTLNISIEVKDKSNSTNTIKLGVDGIELDKNGATGVKLTIPAQTVVSATQTGLSLGSFASDTTVTSTTTSALVNTDLSFNIDTLKSVLNSNETAISDALTNLETYFQQVGSYDVSIKITGNIIPIEFTTITGTVNVIQYN